MADFNNFKIKKYPKLLFIANHRFELQIGQATLCPSYCVSCLTKFTN